MVTIKYKFDYIRTSNLCRPARVYFLSCGTEKRPTIKKVEKNISPKTMTGQL
jgi:hypothetical protein